MTAKRSVASRYLETINAENIQNQNNSGTSNKKQEDKLSRSAGFNATKISSSEKLEPPVTPKRLSRLSSSFGALQLGSPSTSPIKSSYSSSTVTSTTTSPTRQPKTSKGYEYLCRVKEIRLWIQAIINEELPSESELANDALCDGVILAKLTQKLKPELVKKIVIPQSKKLGFMASDNINKFFQLMDFVKMPDLFRFELADLYHKQNIPKVILCIHALSFIVSQNDTMNGIPTIQNVSNDPNNDFNESDIKKYNSISLPNFQIMNKQFQREIKPTNLDLNYSKPKEVPVLSKTTPILARPVTPPPAPAPAPQEEIESQPPRSLSPSKTTKLSESKYLETIIRFQAISRGSNFRYKMFVDKIILRSLSESIVELQSLIRGASARRNLVSGIDETKIIEFQSIARGAIVRKTIHQLNKFEDKFLQLQNIIRGAKVRALFKSNSQQLLQNEKSIIELQSLIRKYLIYDRFNKLMKTSHLIIPLQSQVRGFNYRQRLQSRLNSTLTTEGSIISLQSIIKGNKCRSEIDSIKKQIKKFTFSIQDFQAIARGAISRNKLNYILDVLDLEDGNLNRLVAISKGKKVRSNLNFKKNEIFSEEIVRSVVKLQSSIRGVLSRYGYELFLDRLEQNEPEIIELQSAIRRILYKNFKNEILNHYLNNINSVIKIQNAIRTKYFGKAYKSLISMNNPPLSAIRKFAYLLNDNDVDFDEEIQLTKFKELIIEKNKANEDLENKISQLDLKIVLLQKNKLSFSDLVSNNKNILSKLTNSQSTIDITSLNKKSKLKIELYEKFFYLLQTQPIYLTRLIINDLNGGTEIALKIFNKLNNKREEYLFIKFLQTLFKEIIFKLNSIKEFEETEEYWFPLVREINASCSSEIIQEHLGPVLQEVINDEELDIEYDPIKLYQSIHYSPNSNITIESAMEDPETKQLFITNLQKLRDYSTKFLKIVLNNLNKIPIHMKLLLKSILANFDKKFHNIDEGEKLSALGEIFISYFLKDLIEIELEKTANDFMDSKQTKNVSEIFKILKQLFSMKPFGDDEFYLQPLNKFIIQSNAVIFESITSMVNVNDIDNVFQMSVYDDMISHNRPKLVIRISDMLWINEVILNKIDLISPNKHDDNLRNLIFEIKSVNANHDRVFSKINGLFTLKLNPSINTSFDEEFRVKSLFLQVKRCILYLIQIEDGADNLFELLTSKINILDEIKFKELVMRGMSHNEYNNEGNGSLGYDLSKITYKFLKTLALEKILELEELNLISRSDNFQTILNDIADDIKNKHDQRLLRKNELNVVSNTLVRLQEKNKFLRDQLKNYNQFINSSIENLQNKNNNKSKKSLPFTRQFFYERELKKIGQFPKFGAYKYSFKKLQERGIIIELNGINRDELATSGSFFTGISYPKIDFMFNCDKAGIFEISVKSSSIAITNDKQTLTLDKLLEYQYDNLPSFTLFNDLVKFDTTSFMNFILKKFYHFEES